MKKVVFLLFAFYLMAASNVSGEDKAGGELDEPPMFIRVYSKDGRESLTTYCRPKITTNPKAVSEVGCKFTHVRIELPKSTVSNEIDDAIDKIMKDPKALEKLNQEYKMEGKPTRDTLLRLMFKEK